MRTMQFLSVCGARLLTTTVFLLCFSNVPGAFPAKKNLHPCIAENVSEEKAHVFHTGDALSSFETNLSSPPASISPLVWSCPAYGLELGLARLPESLAKNSDAAFVVVRIDAAQRAFALGMASEKGMPRSLPEWSRSAGFAAGINASMYLPDKITSTGYLRNGDTVNNANIGKRLGAFFVAGPHKTTDKPADIIERDSPEWRERLEKYDIVVQNYRLVSASGALLWNEGGAEHSIAAITVDKAGRVLFLLCQEPLTVELFVRYVRLYVPDSGVLMYVEGGAQAGLFVCVDDEAQPSPQEQKMPGEAGVVEREIKEGDEFFVRDFPPAGEENLGKMDGMYGEPSIHQTPNGRVYVWKGRQSILQMRGNPHAVLPNVLGVLR